MSVNSKPVTTPMVLQQPSNLRVTVTQKPPRLVRWGCHLTSWGRILVGMEGEALCRLDFVPRGDIQARLMKWRRDWPGVELVEDQRAGAAIIQQLFPDKIRKVKTRKAAPMNALSIALHGTAFQTDVWKALARIPLGKVCSYGDLARRIGKPRASRAVGAAVGSNPVSVIIPCHRVLASDGSLHGFGWGLPMKKKLLTAEGFLPIKRAA